MPRPWHTTDRMPRPAPSDATRHSTARHTIYDIKTPWSNDVETHHCVSRNDTPHRTFPNSTPQPRRDAINRVLDHDGMPPPRPQPPPTMRPNMCLYTHSTAIMKTAGKNVETRLIASHLRTMPQPPVTTTTDNDETQICVSTHIFRIFANMVSKTV